MAGFIEKIGRFPAAVKQLNGNFGAPLVDRFGQTPEAFDGVVARDVELKRPGLARWMHVGDAGHDQSHTAFCEIGKQLHLPLGNVPVFLGNTVIGRRPDKPVAKLHVPDPYRLE